MCEVYAAVFQESHSYNGLFLQPCPVPNGAAGLHLLGDICKKSNRRERAMHYYRLSLKVCYNE